MSRQDRYNSVHTTLPPHLKRQATLDQIDYAEALRLGVTMLCSMNELTDEENMEAEISKMKQEIKELHMKVQIVEDNLSKLREKKKVDPDLEKKKLIAKGLRANNPLRYV